MEEPKTYLGKKVKFPKELTTGPAKPKYDTRKSSRKEPAASNSATSNEARKKEPKL